METAVEDAHTFILPTQILFIIGYQMFIFWLSSLEPRSTARASFAAVLIQLCLLVILGTVHYYFSHLGRLLIGFELLAGIAIGAQVFVHCTETTERLKEEEKKQNREAKARRVEEYKAEICPRFQIDVEMYEKIERAFNNEFPTEIVQKNLDAFLDKAEADNDDVRTNLAKYLTLWRSSQKTKTFFKNLRMAKGYLIGCPDEKDE